MDEDPACRLSGEILTGFPQCVMCLFLGVLGVETGLLHKNEMDGTKSLLSGFVSITFLSTVAAGFLVGFMQQLVRLGFFAAKRAGGRCSGTAADRGFAKFRRQGAPDLVHSFRHFIERDRKANAGQR